MTQEDKELLMKDLCARLPYEVFCNIGLDYPLPLQSLFVDKLDGILLDFYKDGKDYQVYLSEVKPYLFPLSSMTDAEQEELEQEHSKDEMLYIECLERAAKGDNSMRGKVITHYAMDWCNKNHFDYRGLIEKGLAIDATSLNIY